MIPEYPIIAILQTLYSGTIRFNILLGATRPASEITQDEIEDACRNANILDFINSLPEYVTGPPSHSSLELIVLIVDSIPKSAAREVSCRVDKSVS